MKTLFKNKTLTMATILAIGAIIIAVYGLTTNANAATLPNNITIEIKTVLYVGDMEVIDCSDKTVCTSSDDSVAYIDEDGFIVAAAPGEAIITVKDGKNTSQIPVYVPNVCAPGDHNYSSNKDGKLTCSKCNHTR